MNIPDKMKSIGKIRQNTILATYLILKKYNNYREVTSHKIWRKLK